MQSNRFMEYHYGVCVKESNWAKDNYNSIVILAGDSNDNELAFFVKIFDINEEVDNNLKDIKLGCPVFFTSEKECIIDLYNVDCMFNTGCSSLNIGNLRLEKYRVWVQDNERPNVYLPKMDVINNAEVELMNALQKKRLFDSFSNAIKEFTAENLQKIINEEKDEVEKYDIEDLVNVLNISYYANRFYEKNDSPESYNLYEKRSFVNTKYEDFKLDEYLTQILKPGGWDLGENEGWFYAREEAEKDIENNTSRIPFIKNEMIRTYSRDEHLSFRVRSKLSKYISPIFSMLTIPGYVLDLKIDHFWHRVKGYYFSFYRNDTKESIISEIRSRNHDLRPYYERHDKIKREIYRTISFHELLKEWCIPFSSYVKANNYVYL